VDEESVALGGPKERALLAALAIHAGRVVTVSQIVDELWEDEPPRSAGKTIQTYVSHLRRALPPGAIETVGGGYRLAIDPGCVDAVRFERLADDGHRALTGGDGQRALTLLDEANSLWRGAPFAELGGLRFAEAESTRLEEVRLRVVEDRIEASLCLGEARRLVADLERLVRAHPLRERLWGQLMLALHRSARQAEALATFGRARTALVDGAGVEPGAELQAIERSLLEADAKPSGTGVPAARASTVTRTVLLTDMEGSTAAWERDPEAMSLAVSRHDELVATIVEGHGGTLVPHKGEGDSTFSVFERATAALAAALDIQLAIAAEPWPTPEPLSVRAALHTGEVEQRDGDYLGRTVNRAARMRSLSLGGTIVLSGTTASLVADALPERTALVDLGEQELRGVARPERLHALAHPALGDPATALAHLRRRRAVPPTLLAHGDAPLIGRAQELDDLLETWVAAVAGRPSLALVGGDPGIGKTRLVAELAARVAADGAQVFFGRSDEEPLRPYQPIAEALADGLDGMPLPELRGAFGDHRLADLALIVPELRDRLAAADRGEVSGDRFAVLEAAAAAMRLIAERAPLLVVLDDLHWADDATLQLLRHLPGASGRCRC
jgi:DNA-binding SARP family transcriptional activator